VALHVTAEVMDLEALLALVAIGDAVTFVGEDFKDMAAQTAMTWRPVEDLHIHLSGFVTWRAKDSAAPAVRALIDSAHEVRAPLKAGAARAASGPSKATRPPKR
jgi:LysR family transcriptional regulator, benzoate and cis,cis-muconate-responsive activator of ben and cat genes